MKIKNYLDILSHPVALSVLRIYAKNQSAYTGRHLATLVGVNHVTCTEQLEKLVSAGVLEKNIVGRSYLYKPRRQYLIQQVILPLIANEQKLYRDFKKELQLLFSSHCMGLVIYGSYAENKETSQSDIDICFIIGQSDASFEKKLESYTETLEERYGLVFEPLILTQNDFIKAQETGLIRSLIEKGDWLVGQPKSILKTHEKNR